MTAETPLQLAVRNGHRNAILRLLKYGAKTYDRTSGSILDYAVSNGSRDIALFLLNDCGVETSSYTLMRAVDRDTCRPGESMVETFVTEVPDINIISNTGYNALHLAVCWTQPNLCRILLEHGADVNLRNDTENKTPMEMETDDSVRAVLIEYGAN